MKISVNQTKANLGIEYKAIVDGEEKYIGKSSRIASIRENSLFDKEERKILYTKYHITKTSYTMITSYFNLGFIFFANKILGIDIGWCVLLDLIIIIGGRFLKDLLFYEKINELKYLQTSIWDSDNMQVGEFFRKTVRIPLKMGYGYLKTIYNGQEFYYYQYGFGKESGYYIYNNDVQIGATVKNIVEINNKDKYDIYVVNGYEEYELMFIIFAILYDNYYEGNRKEVNIGVKRTYTHIFHGNKFINEKIENKNWIKENKARC